MGVYDYHHHHEYHEAAPEAAVMDPSEADLQGNAWKVYVEVTARFSEEGEIRPLQLVWEDGRKYSVDRICRVQRAASRKAGGAGIRYSCMICGQEVQLYYEGEGRWFVTRKG